MPPTSSELISAVSHPLRRRILFAYAQGTVECASARELAAAMGQRVGQVDYHLKTLARGDILRPVRGDGEGAQEAHCGWALGVEAQWLRLVLEVWAEAEDLRT
ncbi:MAG TPA: helix-turn-helix domain-containing protein [Solirubrobacterales bacterium]|jgi:DNA-binding transcriptional ArsR family regulator|nr:helix-turn-helix domain-containing protein [Solirubrobacterales bacterium]